MRFVSSWLRWRSHQTNSLFSKSSLLRSYHFSLSWKLCVEISSFNRDKIKIPPATYAFSNVFSCWTPMKTSSRTQSIQKPFLLNALASAALILTCRTFSLCKCGMCIHFHWADRQFHPFARGSYHFSLFLSAAYAIVWTWERCYFRIGGIRRRSYHP